MKAKSWVAVALAVVLTGCLVGFLQANAKMASSVPSEGSPRYRTQPVEKGNVAQVVLATGAINPVAVVNVGAQLSGTAFKVHADFNQLVHAGDVLVELDPAIYQAQVRQAKATLRVALAGLEYAKSSYGRNEELLAKAPEMAEKMDLPRADIEVFFDFNSAAITPQAMTTLVVMGQALSDPQLAGQRFVIAGHTDGKGRPRVNLNLSRRRAEAVRQFVIEQYKIEPARLIARGFGSSKPKNLAAPQAEENRRVQIINWTPMLASKAAR